MAQVESEVIRESSTSNNDPTSEESSNTEGDLVARLPTREGWSTPLALYNRCWLRSHMLARFMAVRDDFKPRGGDIILATHPKSGTTWLKALAFAIFNRSRCSLDSHPLLTSHPQTVVPFIGTTGAGAGDLDYLQLQYWRESSARPREVMFLRYEEMAADTLGVARKLASFLGAPFTREEDDRGVAQAQVVSFCSFDSLRNLGVNKAGGVERAGGKLFIQHSSLFRKGKVGDWANHMSKEMGHELDRLVEDKFKGSGRPTSVLSSADSSYSDDEEEEERDVSPYKLLTV